MSDYILIDGALYHHGIKGQKWGLRRWQNEDGSLTPAGREHYGYGEARTKLYNAKQAYKQAKRESNKAYNKAYNYSSYHPLTQFMGKKAKAESNKRWEDFYEKNKKEDEARKAFKEAKKEYKNSEEYKQAKDKAKKIAIAGAAVVGAALAAYGTYKVAKNAKLFKEYSSQAKKYDKWVKELDSYNMGIINTARIERNKGAGGRFGNRDGYMNSIISNNQMRSTYAEQAKLYSEAAKNAKKLRF